MTTDTTPPSDDAPNPGMVRADLLAGLFFIILGLAIFYGAWTMDRLEVRRIQPLTAPGLVPGLLSAALTLCGFVLAFRSLRTPADGGWQQLSGAMTSGAAGRALIVMLLAHPALLGGHGPIRLRLHSGVRMLAGRAAPGASIHTALGAGPRCRDGDDRDSGLRASFPCATALGGRPGV